MSKSVWITSMSSEDKALTTGVLGLARKYGLAPDGHFWTDDVDRMAWQAPLEKLLARDTALWVIAGSKKDFQEESVRYGLSLLALRLQHVRGLGFPMIIVSPDQDLTAEDLPTPFKGAEIFVPELPTLGAKMTARANTPVKPVESDYRINIHANQGYGIWYELGPAREQVWKGVLAGGLKAEVTAHGVGPSGELPVKTVLEYQMQGLKLELGEEQYTAWAVQNQLDKDLSYYVKFNGNPGTILFGELPGEETEAEFHLLALE